MCADTLEDELTLSPAVTLNQDHFGIFGIYSQALACIIIHCNFMHYNSNLPFGEG